jgi:hypothetical protein
MSPPPGAAEADAVIVWVPDDTLPLGIRSVWLSSSSKETGGAVWITAMRQEPVVASGSSLHAIRIDQEIVRVCDCTTCDESACKKLAKETSSLDVPVSVDLTSGKKQRLLDPIGSAGCDGRVASIYAAFGVGSAFGSFVDVSQHVANQACDAPHPFFFDERHFVDVATGRDATLSPSKAQIDLLVPRAQKELAEAHEGCVSGDDDTSFWGVALEWGPSAVARGAYTFIRSAPYMCGTGPGHYSVETTMVSDLPETHPPLPEIPPWVTEALRGGTPRGLSPVDEKARAKLVGRFRSAPVPVPRRTDG